MSFRSKIDGWFIATIVITVTVLTATSAGALRAGATPALLVVPLAGVAMMLWTAFGTRYVVTDSDLRVRCGVFSTSVPLATIRQLRRSRSMMSAPALSMDRLEVVHAAGTIVVSPADQAGFVSAIQGRRPQVTWNDRIEPVPLINRLAPWGLLILPVAILSGAGFLLFSNGEPMRARLTADTLVVEGSRGLSIPLADMTSASLENRLPKLRMSIGVNTFTTMRGGFSNDALGEGHAFVRRNAPPYVLVRTGKSFVLFNLEESADTRQLYAALSAQIAER